MDHHDDTFSVPLHGDLRHAESREVATSRTPDRVVDEMERTRHEQEVLRANDALQAAFRRGHAAEIERAEARYEAAMDAYLAWQAEGVESHHEVPAPAKSLRDLLDGSDAERLEIKLEAWRELLAFICPGRKLSFWAGFKNFVAFARRVDPERFSKISQKTWAWLFGETRAATSAREKRVVEEAARELGISAYHLLGGTKSDTARRRYSASQRGNCNRRKARGGKKR